MQGVQNAKTNICQKSLQVLSMQDVQNAKMISTLSPFLGTVGSVSVFSSADGSCKNKQKECCYTQALLCAITCSAAYSYPRKALPPLFSEARMQ